MINDLEQKCRDLLRRKNTNADGSPREMIEAELRLTLGQIDAVRRLHDGLRRRLEEQRLQMESKLLNLEPQKHHSNDYWFERNRLQNQLTHTLVRLEQQFQQLMLQNQKTMQSLQQRLLELWNMRAQLQ